VLYEPPACDQPKYAARIIALSFGLRAVERVTETQKNMLPAGQWKARIFLAKLFGKKILWWSIGINLHHTNPEKIRFLFSGKKTTITVRDKKSQETLTKIGIKSEILPDAVFGYDPTRHSDLAILDSESRSIPVIPSEVEESLKNSTESDFSTSLRSGRNDKKNISTSQ